MRFEYDNYDVDVYSLCESVYYSCNNDEYNYVLECVNDWIYNGYNDNILLETIMAAPIIFTKNRGTDFNFDGHLVPNTAEKDYIYKHKINRMSSFDPEFSERGPTSKIMHTTVNGKNIIGKYVHLPSFIKSLPPELANKMKAVVGDGYERYHAPQTNDREAYEKSSPGRPISMFIGYEYKDNGKGEVPKMMSDEAIARIYTKHMDPKKN